MSTSTLQVTICWLEALDKMHCWFLIKISPWTWSGYFAKKTFFFSRGTYKTLGISLICPFVNLNDTSPWPRILWVVLSTKNTTCPWSMLVYVINDWISWNMWWMTLKSTYQVCSWPSLTTMVTTYSFLLDFILDCCLTPTFATIQHDNP